VAISEGTAALATERDRLADLYVRHVARAVGLARLLTGDDRAAEDIAHEAFVRVAGRFGQLRRPDAFDAYLRRTVVNLCRARFRRLRVEREWLRRQDRREPVVGPVVDVHQHDLVWRAVSKLPWRQRAAVVLRYYEDLTVEQSAETLRCSRRAVDALISRAFATLRNEILEEDES
jgi:RNA polymerase sigma factor (sigma-70 family)